MNHVVIVRKNKIEKIKMDKDLSLLLSVIFNPINSEVLSKLNENRNNNVDNPWLKKYYDNILRFIEIGERYDDGSEFFKYLGVENVMGKWFDDVRQTMMIVANDVGEKKIANYVKPSSGVDVTAELTSLCNCGSLSLSTFNIIRVTSTKGKAKLIVRENDNERQVDVKDEDVVLVADEKMLENTTVEVVGYGEILSIQPDLSSKPDKTRDDLIKLYLDGKVRKEDLIYILVSYASDVMSTTLR